MYKTFYIATLLFILPFQKALAQNENKKDSIIYDNEILNYEKTADGFLIDSKLRIIPPPPLLPSLFSSNYNLTQLRPLTDFKLKFRLNSNVIYDGLNSISSHHYTSPLYLGNPNFNLQSVTYKLKNGLHITTYGEYDADGYKTYDPSALPWEKNRFNGAFEVKSQNGNFGIRVGVQKY